MLVDYVSKWIEAVATKAYDAKTVVNHVKSLILRTYGVPKAIISDKGTHFYNKTLGALLAKYHVINKVPTGYHPQTNGQAEISNEEIKGILGMVVKPNKIDWSFRLEKAL